MNAASRRDAWGRVVQTVWCARQHARFVDDGACIDVGLVRPYRDAEPFVVTVNTGAVGPRLVSRGPPGPKAAPSLPRPMPRFNYFARKMGEPFDSRIN